MDSIANLKDLLVEKVDRTYRSEKMKLDHLPEFQDRLRSERSIDLIRDEIERTQESVKKLERILEELGATAREQPSKATEGWIADTKRTLYELEGAAVIDSAIAGALLQIDHYNAAAYGAIAAYAELFEHYEVAALSQECLKASKEAGEQLRGSAENEIDPLALS
ncbi:MAG: DUF892 family protein [Flavobacteriales bacterium]